MPDTPKPCPWDDDADDGAYMRRLAKYSHQGCPGVGMEDNCADPGECAADGACRIIREQSEPAASIAAWNRRG